MAFTVRFSEQAKRDFDRIILWMVGRSANSAARLAQAYEASVDRMSQFPLAYGLAPESVHLGFDVRQLFFKTPHGKQYRALFTIMNDEVWMLHVRGPGQDLVRDVVPPP